MAPSRKRTATRKRSPTKTGIKSSPKPVAADQGAVTLAEAKALALATRPKLALHAARKRPVPPASPAAVGAERAQLDKERRDEFARRIREYQATMAIMKERGARRPGRRDAGGPRAAKATMKAESFVPLQIFAEGDSWFDYPVPFFGGGIIPRLEQLVGVPILNLAKAGDEVRYMLGVEERTLLAEHLSKGCPAGGPWEALLFSGGGNDVVDNPMALWVRDFDSTVPPAQLINQKRYDTAVALVRAGYEDVIALRDKLSPGTHLIFHGYDLAIPDGRGICNYGPWLKPTFDLHQFPARPPAQAVVNGMLQQFAAMLSSFANRPKVTVIKSQGTLPQQTSSWHNELHPTRAGFQKFAELFRDQLKTLFPNRIA